LALAYLAWLAESGWKLYMDQSDLDSYYNLVALRWTNCFAVLEDRMAEA